MFITIDGFSGAGKSTQSERLNSVVDGGLHKLDIGAAVWGILPDSYATPVVTNQACEHIALILAFCVHAPQIIANPDKAFYCEDFWFNTCQGSTSIDVVKEKWVIFQNALHLAGVPKPDLSIYLDVPELVRDRRVAKRNIGVTKEDLERLAMKEKSGVRFDWGHHMGIVCQDIIDRFHVIDGAQSVDKVTTDIFELINRVSEENG